MKSLLLGVTALSSTLAALSGTPITAQAGDPHAAWSQPASASLAELPPGRRAAGYCYDSVRHRLIVFGGFPVYLGDLWAFDLDTGTWEEITPSGTGPTPRYGPTMIYDAANDRLVIFGGFDGTAQRNDVYSVNLSGSPVWTLLATSGAPPAARSFHVAAYDAPRQRMVMFSGYNGSWLNDTWELSLGAAPAWTQLTGSTPPPPRNLAAVAIDTARERMMVFGGWEESTQTYYHDTWAFSLASSAGWSQVAASSYPPGRREISMIYDPIGDRLVLFGGNDGTFRYDSWSLDLAPGGNWSPIGATGSVPSGRYGHASYYDPVGHNLFIFGGNSFEQHLNDLYRLNLSGPPQWTDVLGPPPPPPPSNHAPVIDDVRDVPHDQGGHVFVTWLASDLDVIGINTITGYRVWRRIHPQGTVAGRAAAPTAQASNEAKLLRTLAPNGTTVVFWEALVDLPAQKLEGYGYTAPTTQDSIQNSNPYTAFFVTALTANSSVFYSSAVDSGYSVDNLKPGKPRNAVAAVDPGGLSIAWEAPDETITPDVQYYRVYRGNTAGFTPDASHQIGQTSELAFVDEGSIGAHYYKLTTVDLRENESDAETLDPLSPVAVGDAAAEFALRGSTPSPARPSHLTIGFSLPTGMRATLELFDLSGRRVVAREVGRLGPGSHQVNLAEGRALRAGVYLVRLVQGDRSRSIKAIVAP